jgi:putative ABC transport system permease protein
MLRLAFANLWHRKVRSLLSILAVAVGIMMLVVLVSLSRGSVDEVRRRFESVDAELVVTQANWDPTQSEAQMMAADKRAERLEREVLDSSGKPLIKAVIPVLVAEVTMAGQRQRVFGIHPDHWGQFAGSRKLLEGRLLDDPFGRTLRKRSLAGTYYDFEAVPPEELRPGLQLLIDDRLARAGFRDPQTGQKRPYAVGDKVRVMGDQEWTVVGVVESGVAGRVFAPIWTLRHFHGRGEGATVMFVKLHDPARAAEAEDTLRDWFAKLGVRYDIQLKNAYGKVLLEQVQSILLFTDVISGLSLAVSFLVILLTVYTMVVERTHEIGILRSLGASRTQVLLEIVAESVMISGAGTLAGVGLSYAVAAGIHTFFPLLTVEIRVEWLAVAAALGVLGGALAALVPAWMAARADPVAALSHF